MTRSYRQELELVQREYDTVKCALVHVVRQWSSEVVIEDVDGRSLEHFKRAERHLEVTYTIRLFATL